MKCLSVLLALVHFAKLTAEELKTTGAGIEISSGSLGSFTMMYPEFDPVHKQIEVKAAGAQATVRYEGGAECAIAISKGEIGLVFKGVPAGVKSYKMSVLIDIGFAKGGAWKIADKEGIFPAEKAGQHHP